MTDHKHDKALGMGADITRRDFVNGLAAGAAGALLAGGRAGAKSTADASAQAAAGLADDPWTGPSCFGDYQGSNGNTAAVRDAAHAVRDELFDDPFGAAKDAGEIFDLVVVGGGFAGLGAAFTFLRGRKDGQSCLILDNHPVIGGEAKLNEFNIGGERHFAPQGSNDFIAPTPLARKLNLIHPFWDELGLPSSFEIAELTGAKRPIAVAQDNFGPMTMQPKAANTGFFFRDNGAPLWLKDCVFNGFGDAPMPQALGRDIVRLHRETEIPAAAPEQFEAWLDGMTYQEFLEGVLGLSPGVTEYMHPILAASGGGLGADVVSAYCAYLFGMPGTNVWYGGPEAVEQLHFTSFPGGNAGTARQFLKALIPNAIPGENSLADVQFNRIDATALDVEGAPVRFRGDAMVIAVKHEGSPAEAETVAIVFQKGGELYKIRAKGVVVAAGGWVAKRVVADLPDAIYDALDGFVHAPMLVANVALRNWRFMEEIGVSAARWFDEDWGWYTNIRAPMRLGGKGPALDPSKPTVLSNYVPFLTPGLDAAEQASLGRAALLSASYAEIERRIRRQYAELFGAQGFDPARDIAGVILNRWGHAYVAPEPGFYFGKGGEPAPRDVVRNGFGRIAFGHSELSGYQLWSTAVGEGERAANALLSS